MFKFTVTTVRPTANAPFFIHTALGQVYQEQMMFAKSARPKGPDQANSLISFERTESEDGLTMIADYSFVSSTGKDELFAEEDAKAIEAGMPTFQTARNAYNAEHGHVSTHKVEII
jgi:hypothetical protein